MSRWRTWGEIPTFMKNDFSLKYYRHLSRKRTSMVFKRIFDPSDLFSVNPYHIKTAGNVILKSIPDKINSATLRIVRCFCFPTAAKELPLLRFFRYFTSINTRYLPSRAIRSISPFLQRKFLSMIRNPFFFRNSAAISS